MHPTLAFCPTEWSTFYAPLAGCRPKARRAMIASVRFLETNCPPARLSNACDIRFLKHESNLNEELNEPARLLPTTPSTDEEKDPRGCTARSGQSDLEEQSQMTGEWRVRRQGHPNLLVASGRTNLIGHPPPAICNATIDGHLLRKKGGASQSNTLESPKTSRPPKSGEQPSTVSASLSVGPTNKTTSSTSTAKNVHYPYAGLKQGVFRFLATFGESSRTWSPVPRRWPLERLSNCRLWTAIGESACVVSMIASDESNYSTYPGGKANMVTPFGSESERLNKFWGGLHK
ncbi:hypothetical protein FA13DRAFT_1712408 [Coprinellus micaceus]|uniref:Uncharacterized protein n=1 Tax=Coprinellus micaceus TaxID=71717 RepID=A0A4Y7T212_COPMI|nr:hypothetical protein FA13DRAFT_1712408 [Coprinellus micaceus]